MLDKALRLLSKASEYSALMPSETDRRKLFSLSRKVNDITSECNTFLSYASYPEDSPILDEFLKRATFVSTDIPEIIPVRTVVEFDVTFKNMGIFFSWDTDKKISLLMELVWSDGIADESEYFPLIVTASENVPGEETENGDYGLDKIFHCSHEFISDAGEYILRLTIVDEEQHLFDTPFVLGVSLVD